MKSRRKLARALLAAMVLLLAGRHSASAGWARDYLNTPVGSNLLILLLTSAHSVTAVDTDLPLPNNESVSGTVAVTFLHSFPIRGKYGGVALNLSYASVATSGASGNAKATGFGDPALTLHANLFGQPAFTRDTFANAVPHTNAAFHLTAYAPLGTYNPSSAANVGSNRWAFVPKLNLSITPDKGQSWIEAFAGVQIYTNNNAYKGTNQLTQRPLYNLEAHYSHNFARTSWAAIDLYYDAGGETFVNGAGQANAAHGFRPGAIVSTRIWPGGDLALHYENTSSSPNTASSTGLWTLRLIQSL